MNAKFYGTALLAAGLCVVMCIGLQAPSPVLLSLVVLALVIQSLHLRRSRARERRVHADSIANLHTRTIEALALAVEAKDDTTHDHLRRVQVYAMEVGRELGLNQHELEALRAAAVLHDIGKLAVPESIISKPGKLTPLEFDKMKIHPIVGAEILEHIQFPYPVAPIVRSHHEKWNGAGYPDGLRGEAIPIGARILSAVDTLDALASDRQYRRALPLGEAMSKVEQESGQAFDPAVVEILRRRYVDLEKKAQMATVGTVKLSLHSKVTRGEAPAAGFERSAPNAPIAAGTERTDTLRAKMEAMLSSPGPSGPYVTGDLLALLQQLVPFDALALYRIAGDALHPECVGSGAYAAFSSQSIPLGQGLSGWVAENRQSILNGNPSVEPGFLKNPCAFGPLRSALAVPLHGASAPIGVLSLYHEACDAFTRDQLRLLEAIAPKLACSMECGALELAAVSASSVASTNLSTGSV